MENEDSDQGLELLNLDTGQIERFEPDSNRVPFIDSGLHSLLGFIGCLRIRMFDNRYTPSK